MDTARPKAKLPTAIKWIVDENPPVFLKLILLAMK